MALDVLSGEYLPSLLFSVIDIDEMMPLPLENPSPGGVSEYSPLARIRRVLSFVYVEKSHAMKSCQSTCLAITSPLQR